MNLSAANNQPLNNIVYTRQCELATLSDIQWDLEQLFRDWVQDDTHLNFITLSIVEALANIFEHGLENINNQSRDVILNIARDKPYSIAQIIDNGKPTPATVRDNILGNNLSMPDVEAPELPESGWGLNLIQFAASTIEHKRVEDKNYLELTFDDKPVTGR